MSNSIDTPILAVPQTQRIVQTAAPARHHRRWWLAGTLIVATTLALVTVSRRGPWSSWLWGEPPVGTDIYTVQPTTLSVTLKEDGELKPVNSVEVKCEVQGQGMSRSLTIKSIVPESTQVKKGDLLVELASDEMQDRVETEEMELRRIASALEEAHQALKITQSENASTLKKAEIDLEVAQLELKRYLEGDYERQKKQIDINIKQTVMDINQQQEELRKSRDLKEKGFVTAAKLEELEAALEKAEMTLDKYKLELTILEAYELPKNRMQKTSAVERAEEELQRERQRAESREKQAQARLRDQEETLKIRQSRFERLKEQLDNCKIYAPVDGMVQYGESGGHRYWNANRIAPGEAVNPGQTLLTIPDTSRMLVSTRIHEADRHKVAEGMPCVVRVPAVPGPSFHGQLSKIAQFADSERSWWNPELKEHATEIILDESDAPLSPGDTAHVEILIEEVHDALAVPVQCVFARGPKRFVFVQRGTTTKPVEVEVGRSSTTMIEVLAGLKAGDHVSMAPSDELLALLPMPGTQSSSFETAGAESTVPQATGG